MAKMAEVEELGDVVAEEKQPTTLSDNDRSPSNTQIIFPAYTVYRYSEKRNNENDEEDDSTDHASLQMFVSTLSPENEEVLYRFVTRKLNKGSIYSGAGNISGIELKLEAGDLVTPQHCYYCLLKDTQESNVGDYIVCLIAPPEAVLDLFKPELDTFTFSLQQQLTGKDEQRKAVLTSHIERWYDHTIQYLCRCVQRLGEDIKYLIHAAMVDASLDIHSDEQQVLTDLKSFLECCSLSELLSSIQRVVPDSDSSPTSSDNGGSLIDTEARTLLADISQPAATPLAKPTLHVTIDNNKHSFQTQDCTQFCEEWAHAMASGETSNPVFLRQVIENYKLKAIQDMNTLKRLLKQAETDHYCLYRCYMFLKTCGNGSILLQHAELDSATLRQLQGHDVIEVLKQYKPGETPVR